MGTTVVFRLGLSDAETFAEEFYPEMTIADILNLPNYHIHLKLMIDGRLYQPFSAETIMPR